MHKVQVMFYVLMCGGALWGYLRYVEARLVFAPSKVMAATPAVQGLAFEEVLLTTEDAQQICGWYLPAKSNFLSGEDAPSTEVNTLLFLHGNAGNMGDRLDKLALFHEIGLNVFIIDYRGYGRSEGRPTEAGIYRDATAAYEYLLKREAGNFQRLVVYGASLGGAVAVDLAQRREVAGVILDSTFTSAVDMGRWLLPMVPQWMIRVQFNSLDKIEALKGVPKLFFHSEEDTTVPFALGQALFAKAPEPRVFVSVQGGHTEAHLWDSKKFKEAIKTFLKQIARSASATSKP